MKVNTKAVFEWDDSKKQYVETHNESFNYDGEVAECKWGDPNWWLGDNSLFAKGIKHTKYGAGGGGDNNINVPTDIGLDQETQTLIIAAVVAFILFK